MKKILIIGLGLFISFLAHSQDSKRESIEELLLVANVDSMMDSMHEQMAQAFEGIGKQLGVKPDEQPVFDAYMKKVFTAMQEDMNWKKIKDPMIDIYLKHYTEKEVQDMLDFYKSETGRSMVRKMPVVMGESMQLSQQMMQSFFPKIKSMAQELQNDLKEHRSKQ